MCVLTTGLAIFTFYYGTKFLALILNKGKGYAGCEQEDVCCIWDIDNPTSELTGMQIGRYHLR